MVPRWNFAMQEGLEHRFGCQQRRSVSSLVENGLSARGDSVFADVERLIVVI